MASYADKVCYYASKAKVHQCIGTIREIGVLKLPGESVLKDYTNVIGPKTGINPSVLDEIKSEASKLPEEKRWVVLMHDEMSIKSDLVYDNRSSTLVGYVDSSSWKFSQQQNKYEDELATHVLSFYDSRNKPAL